MNALSRAFRAATQELAGNARLRSGVWLILAIVLGYLIVVQSDRIAAAHRDYAAETDRLTKAEWLLERQDWPELLKAERATHQSLRATFWEAETEGIAQAKLQGALNVIVEGVGLRKPRIHSGVSQPVPDLPGIWRVQSRLDATYRPGVELQLLHALAMHPKKLIVDRLDLRQRQRQDAYLTLILSAYFVGVEAQQTQ